MTMSFSSPRPRRFGKTTNQSMLQAFFEKPAQEADSKRLFDGLLVSEHADVMQHQGRYPVISLTFKDVKATCWQEAYGKLCTLLHREILRHTQSAPLAKEGEFYRIYGHTWKKIVDYANANSNDWEESLALLTQFLTFHYNQDKPKSEWVRPIVLLDEYDAPIHSALCT